MSINTLPEGLHSSTIAMAMRADMDFNMDATTRKAIESLGIREAKTPVGRGVVRATARKNRKPVMARIEKARQHNTQARKQAKAVNQSLSQDADWQAIIAEASQH